jgi:O-antigen/teichoic acid export membrane protein
MFSQGIASLNLYRAVDYFVPQYITSGQFGKARGMIKNILLISGISTIIGGIVVFISIDKLVNIFNEPRLSSILPFFWLLIPIITIKQLLIGLFKSIKKMKYRVYIRDILDPLGRIVAVASLLLLGGGLIGLATGYLLGIMIAVAIGIVFVVMNIDWIINTDTEKIPRKKLFSYSLPLLFAGVIYSITGRIDYFMIGYFMDSADVGFYRVAFLLATNLLIVLRGITPVFKPMVSEDRNHDSILQNRYQLATRWISILTIPIAITFLFGSEIYLSLFFAPEYAAGSAALIALTGGYLLNASFGPEGMMLEGLGHTRLTLLNTVLLLVVNGTLDVILIPKFGIVGAGLGTACAITIAGAAGVLELFYLRGFHPYTRSLLISWAAAIFPMLFGGVIMSFASRTIFWGLFLPLVVLITYTVAIRELGVFTEDDAMVVKNIDAKIGYPVMSKISGL